MKKLIYYLLLLIHPVFATTQIDDILITGNIKKRIAEHPFSIFLIDSTDGIHFDVKSNGNYKGYTAEWKINNDSLFLIYSSRTKKLNLKK